MAGALTRMLGRSPSGGLTSIYGNHAYWRVFVTDNWGSASFVVIQEVEFLDPTGTVISASGGTVLKSSESAGNEGSKAFDGTSTDWYTASGSVANQYVGYQFASAKPVQSARITTDSGGTTTIPKHCSLQYSDDGSSWSTAFSFVQVNFASLTTTFPESPAAGAHKFWRVFCVDNNGGSAFISIDDVQFRATSGGADQVPVQTSDSGDSTSRVLGSSSFGGGNEMYRAFDSNTTGSNPWASSGTTNQYIGAVLTTAIVVQEVSIQAPTGSFLSRAPKNMTIDYSDDGTTWTTQKTLAAQTGWTAGEVRVLAAV